MAFIKSKKGKKRYTYYIVYNQKIRLADGSITCKKKWLKVGKNKTEAKEMIRDAIRFMVSSSFYMIQK